MSDVQIRPAVENDQALINQMVKDENLDRTSLHWSHFLMAENAGEVVGIGQIRPYTNCRELGSLVVKKDYRSKGVGGMLVRALLESEAGDVYLECLSHNEGYYARFGFVRIPAWSAPMPLKFKVGIGSIIGPLFGFRVIAMKQEKKK